MRGAEFGYSDGAAFPVNMKADVIAWGALMDVVEAFDYETVDKYTEAMTDGRDPFEKFRTQA